jgi:hypothetical protein
MFDILEYIRLRMALLGYEKYTIKTEYFQSTSGILTVEPKNEIYLLVSDRPFTFLNIFGANEIVSFNNFTDYQTLKAYRYRFISEKFTIVQSPNIDIEFLRIIPEGLPNPKPSDKQELTQLHTNLLQKIVALILKK